MFTRVFTELIDVPLPAFPPAAGESGYWVPELLPFASWDAYDLCIPVRCGEVWEFNPSSGLIVPWTSISDVLEEVRTVVRATGKASLKFYSMEG